MSHIERRIKLKFCYEITSSRERMARSFWIQEA